MTYVDLPDETVHSLPFYLAMEEFLAKQQNEDDCFFMWRVRPTVIFGRNQDMEAEVNVEYCRAHHIEMYRRKSGGGCVYADMGNVMMSMVTRQQDVTATFSRFLMMLTCLLRDLGLPATFSTHNDIMVGDRKVSGNAFYHLPGGSVVHGTMLYDIDMEHLTGSLTPPREKMERHGVQSVRQRVTLLKDHLPQMSLPEFMAEVRQRLCDASRTLTPEEIEGVRLIEQEYLDPAFLYKKPDH